MKIASIAAALAILLASTSSGAPQFTIINPEQARSIEHLCSRSSPEPIQRYWLPGESEVRSAEELLPAYVALAQRPTMPVSEYYRQYVGIVVANRQLLYINLFHRSYLEQWDFIRENIPGKVLPPKDAWLREVVQVCDGGDHYWGVVFDPVHKTFSSPEFNGVAGLPPNKALQLTAARFGCCARSHGRRPPRS